MTRIVDFRNNRKRRPPLKIPAAPSITSALKLDTQSGSYSPDVGPYYLTLSSKGASIYDVYYGYRYYSSGSWYFRSPNYDSPPTYSFPAGGSLYIPHIGNLVSLAIVARNAVGKSGPGAVNFTGFYTSLTGFNAALSSEGTTVKIKGIELPGTTSILYRKQGESNWSDVSRSSYADSPSSGSLSPFTINISNLTPGNTYTYEIKAISRRPYANTTVESNTVTKSITIPLTAPATGPNVTAVATSGQIVFSWPATALATKYRYRRDLGTWTETTALSITISNLINGVTYDYDFQAGNGAGWSPLVEVSATPRDKPVPTLNALSKNSATVGWGAIVGATKYRYRRNNGAWSETTNLSVSFSALTPDTAQTVDVQSYTGAWSNSGQLTFTTLQNGPTPSVRIGYGVLYPYWTALSGVVRYEVSYTPGGATWVSAGTDTKTVLDGLTAGLAYTINVRAVVSINVNGVATDYTTESKSVSGTPVEADPIFVPSVSLSGSTATVSWSAVAGATKYRWRRDSGAWTETNATSFTDSGLNASVTYSYTVQAYIAGSWLAVVDNSADKLWRINPNDPDDVSNLYGDLGSLVSGLTTPSSLVWTGEKLFATNYADHKLYRLNPDVPNDSAGNYGEVGTFPPALTNPTSAAWVDGKLLVLSAVTDKLWNINPDDPDDVSGDYGDKGSLPNGLAGALGAVWSGEKLLVVDNSDDSLWNINPDDPDDVSGDYGKIGAMPAGLTQPNAAAWVDGDLLVIDDGGDELWNIDPDAPSTVTSPYGNRGSFPSALATPRGATWIGGWQKRTSNSASITVPESPPVVTVKEKKFTSLKIGWTAITGATKYRWKQGANGSWTETTGLEFTVTQLTVNTSYTFYVQAYKNNAWGESGSVTGTTNPPIPNYSTFPNFDLFQITSTFTIAHWDAMYNTGYSLVTTYRYRVSKNSAVSGPWTQINVTNPSSPGIPIYASSLGGWAIGDTIYIQVQSLLNGAWAPEANGVEVIYL